MPSSVSSGSDRFDATLTGVDQLRNGRDRGLLHLVGLLYFFSGATGLSYEVLWARLVAAQFGLSTFGSATSVAAFLLGLGSGAALIASQMRRGVVGSDGRGALLAYGALEALVASYALALPGLWRLGGPLLDALAPQLHWWQWCAAQGAAAILLLGLPAAALGAAFPLILHIAPRRRTALAKLYALNTLGAAAGALASLGLLSTIGWAAATRVVALTGTLVAGAAILLAWRAGRALTGPGGGSGHASAAAPTTAIGSGGTSVILAYSAIGAAALMLEVSWTRVYSLVLLRTEYVLAVILCVYLLGSALGAWLGGKIRRSLAWLIPLAACTFTLLGMALLAPLARWVQAGHFDSLAQALVGQALALAFCTLPTTAALGAWLPLLAAGRAAAAAEQVDFAAAIRLYAANCIGGAAGAVVTVAVLIPVLGSVGCVVLAAVLLLALGAVLGATPRLLLAVPMALAGAWQLRTLPPPNRMLTAATATTELYRYEDALSLNQVVETADGQRTLLTDMQHLDASSEPLAAALQADQARLPLLLHPAPRRVLFLGLGTGISAAGSLAWPDLTRTAVELSPGAVRAGRDWFAPINGGVFEHLRVFEDDARHFLAAGQERYDVIVGDLFHPDIAGMGNLLSVEQFQRVGARLAPGGVFAQWLALNQFDRPTLDVVLRSFRAAFPGAQMYLEGAHLAMVGCMACAPAAPRLRANLRGLEPAAQATSTGDEGPATWLGRYWGPIAAGSGLMQHEGNPVIELRLPRLRYDDTQEAGGGPISEILLGLLRRRPDAATAAHQLGVDEEQAAAFSSAYSASELFVQSWLASLDGDGGRAAQLLRLAYEANPDDRWIRSNLAEDLWQSTPAGATSPPDALIAQVLRIYPQHVAALRARWHRDRDAGAPRAQLDLDLARLRAAAPLDREAAAIRVP